MKLSITGRHVDISEPFRQSVDEGLRECSATHHIEPVDVTVALSKEKFLFKTEVAAHLGRGVYLRAQGKAEDAYASFTAALDNLKRRLRRHKKRLVDHHRKHDVHKSSEDVPHYIMEGDIFHSEEEDTTGQELSPAIIAETVTQVPHLSVGEAVMRMDLSDDTAFIFKNAQSDRINFVYRRADGNIGWLDPRGQ